MMLETLEARRLLSVTVTEGYPGFYEIAGTETADVVEATVSMRDENMTLDGITYGNVAYILVNTYGGNDTVTLNSIDGFGSIGASVSTGDGDDTISVNFDGSIWAGEGDDVLELTDSFRGEAYGEGGNDHISLAGYCIDAAVSGGNGNDFIDCADNLDGVLVHGGNGHDTIHGSVFDDLLYGDNGDDVIFGNGGYDTYFSGENVG